MNETTLGSMRPVMGRGKSLWEIWGHKDGKWQLLATARGYKEAVDKAKQLAPVASRWSSTHKVYRADK